MFIEAAGGRRELGRADPCKQIANFENFHAKMTNPTGTARPGSTHFLVPSPAKPTLRASHHGLVPTLD
jgi:hypothetical protein